MIHMSPKTLQSQRGLRKDQNQSHHIKVKLGLDHISRRPDSNNMNDTQIRIRMLKI